MRFVSPYALSVVLLLGSNLFMTFAWYGHLRFKEVPLIGVIVASWLIAFIDYCVAVPANRWGSAVYTTAQLKTIQEVITLLVFAAFSILYLKEPLTWNYAIGFGLIAVGAVLRPARPAVIRTKTGRSSQLRIPGAAEDDTLPICHLTAMIAKGRQAQP
jgi:uncharacterized protein (DUF486 family)